MVPVCGLKLRLALVAEERSCPQGTSVNTGDGHCAGAKERLRSEREGFRIDCPPAVRQACCLMGGGGGSWEERFA